MDDDIAQLCTRRSTLKQQGLFSDAISLQLQILDTTQRHGEIKEISNAWNYLSSLYYHIGSFVDAEYASRRSIEVYHLQPEPVDEVVACYELLLARSLMAQDNYDDAVVYGVAAVNHYSTFHDPPDDFLRGVQQHVNMMMELRDRQNSNAGRADNPPQP
ncbi:MAG: hypothetical protein Q8K78_03155 [Planctomycetaceae bacterium]|nr:hypothetical protein [Planctomycetaceae bacterium]